jgi:hypothetical protein
LDVARTRDGLQRVFNSFPLVFSGVARDIFRFLVPVVTAIHFDGWRFLA